MRWSEDDGSKYVIHPLLIAIMKSPRTVAWCLGLMAVAACSPVLNLGGVDGGDTSGNVTSDGGTTPNAPDSASDEHADASNPFNGSDASNLSASDASDADGASDSATGPGPYGALPSGYCCTEDSQCRSRTCAVPSSGGPSKMCLDGCLGAGWACTSSHVAFQCVSDGGDAMCQPPTSGFACLDPSTFVRGTRKTGDCCAWVETGDLGSECEANRCEAVGSGLPYCTRLCDGPNDCPPAFNCEDAQTGTKRCIPAALENYRCDL